MVVGRAYVKHRFSHTDGIVSDDSHEFADVRLLREHEHEWVSRLSNDHDDFKSWVLMLRDSIVMLLTLFYQGDAVLYRYSSNRNSWS
jgi:hypothetical protein